MYESNARATRWRADEPCRMARRPATAQSHEGSHEWATRPIRACCLVHTQNMKKLLCLAAPVLAAVMPLASAAADFTPTSAFVAGGFAGHAAYAFTAGATWAWKWRHVDQGSEWTGYYEAYA